MGRFGEAAEMAKAALFLASSESSYVTGTEFLVDGGICAAYVTPEAIWTANVGDCKIVRCGGPRQPRTMAAMHEY